MRCHFCKKDISSTDRIGRRDECPSCSSDLHICFNCTFYDPSVYNECRETSAERVIEKDKSNFCDFFQPSSDEKQSKKTDPTDEAKKKLESLFRK